MSGPASPSTTRASAAVSHTSSAAYHASTSTAGAWGGKSNSTSSGSFGAGSGYGSPAYAAMMAKRDADNRQTMKTYAGVLCAFILFFTVMHWGRKWFVNRSLARKESNHRSNVLVRALASLSRRVRSIMVRKLVGFNSMGHGILVALFVAVIVVLTFTNVDLSNASNIATRFGWMTTGTLALVVFLSLKNTPLAYLTAYSYERLNNLHQIAGCTMFLFMCLHAITYTAYFGSAGKLSILTQSAQRAAIVAGFAFLGSFIAAMFIRCIYYELFYAMHIMFFIIGIVCVCFHQPDFGLGIVSIMIFAAAIWVLDRAFRASRVVYNSINNDAAVYPLPNGGTRIVLKKTPSRAVPGKHCFLWIPKIRLTEMHPFTIVGTQPMEFRINSYDGFTAALHRYAVKNPGGKLKASVDGPYGTFPDPMEYDKIVLIAGGSGASFTFGIAVNLLEKMDEESRKKIVFIWAVKSTENLSWYADHLKTIRTHAHSPKVTVSLYVTRLNAAGDMESNDTRRIGHRTQTMSSQSSAANSPISPEGPGEKSYPNLPFHQGQTQKWANALDRDPEKEDMSAAETPSMGVPESPSATTLINKRSDANLSLNMSVVSIPSIPPIPQAYLPAKAEKTGSPTSPTSPQAQHLETTQSRSSQTDVEKHNVTTQGADGRRDDAEHIKHPVAHGRPDAAVLIREAISSTPGHQRVLVAACGPSGMMKAVRDTAAASIRPDGPGVELHCEQFGW